MSEIDQWVETWHTGSDGRSLADFLGMSEEEYAVWVERPESLAFIVLARKRSMSLRDALKLRSPVSIAARTRSKKDAKELLEWMRQTGRI